MLGADRLTVLIFGTSFLLIALLTKVNPESAHEFSRLGTVESLVERGTFALDDSIFIGTRDKVSRNGRFYSHQPPLLSVLETPVYAVLRVTGMRFNNSGRLVMTYLFSLFTNGVALALTAVVFLKVFELAGVAQPLGAALAVVLPFATWLLPYGLVVNNHGASALLLAATAYVLLLLEWRGVTTARVAVLGALLGLLIGIEILPVASFAPLAVIYLLMRGDLGATRWAAFAAALVAPLAVHAIANVRITGDIIPAGFHHELFAFAGTTFEESALTGTIKYASASDAAAYAWRSLFAYKGFFTFAPILALGMVAGIAEWRWWARARGAHLVLLGGALLSLGGAILTTNNFGGEAVGFRHATFLAPALLILLLPWITAGGARRTSVIVVGAVSLLAMLVFASPRPWSILTVENARTGAAADYAPLLTRLIRGGLLEP